MAELKVLGIALASQEGHHLWMLIGVKIPEGINDAAIRKRLLPDFNIETGNGVGALAGKT